VAISGGSGISSWDELEDKPRVSLALPLGAIAYWQNDLEDVISGITPDGYEKITTFIKDEAKTNNVGNSGQRRIIYVGDAADAKPALLLLAKKYVDTNLPKQGFEGKVYVNRGGTGTLNISRVYDIVCVTAYRTSIFHINGNSSLDYLVEATYDNETWYGIYFRSTSRRAIVLDGILWGDYVFITDASGYTVTKIDAGGLYVDTHKVWHEGNDGSGSGLDADTLDGLHASSFLRSDTSDTMSSDLTVSGKLHVNSGIEFSDTSQYILYT